MIIIPQNNICEYCGKKLKWYQGQMFLYAFRFTDRYQIGDKIYTVLKEQNRYIHNECAKKARIKEKDKTKT